MKKPDRQAAPRGVWGQFFRYLRSVKLDWPLIILAMIVNLVYEEVVVYIPGSTAALMSGDFSSSAIMSVVTRYLCQTGLSVVISLITVYATARSIRWAQESIWKRMMGVKTSFYAENTPESLLSAVTSDTQSAVDGIVNLVASTIPSIYFTIRSFQTVSEYNPKLVLSVLVMVPVFVVYYVFIGKWSFTTNFRIQSRIGQLTGYLAERLRNLGLIKSYVTEDQEDANGQKTAQALYKAKLHTKYINAVDAGCLFLTDAISIAVAVVFASVLMRNGELDLEGWLAFFFFLPPLNGALRQITGVWSSLKNTQGYCVRLGRIMDAPQEPTDKGTAPAVGDISFQDVSFSYGEEPVLSHVSFTAPAGKVTAIVGLSGSGKSTMLSLLERLYTPKSGSITMGGKPVDGMALNDYRRRFAYVQQDAGVFSGTFREALTYGVKKPVTDADLVRVTKMAGIHDFITAQPDGFDTRIAIWGSSLSGGQRQRLVIAREVLKDADVLLFDEPTSALDPKTAREIQDTILHAFRGKTILMVSHDLSLIAAADQIVVVDQGQVKAAGPHSQLMQSCPLYHDLVDEQAYQEVFAQ